VLSTDGIGQGQDYEASDKMNYSGLDACSFLTGGHEFLDCNDHLLESGRKSPSPGHRASSSGVITGGMTGDCTTRGHTIVFMEPIGRDDSRWSDARMMPFSNLDTESN
jgi:hypothetical protein